MLDFGREISGNLAIAESREWLCTNGIGGFASGTIAGLLTRRYHGLLVAALKPPVGRTVLLAKLDDSAEYGGTTYALAANRWADGTIVPDGFRYIERFSLDGTTPVWHFACADALLEKRVWMEQEANTTYVRYRLVRAGGPVALTVKPLVNYRDYHSTTRGPGWQMKVEAVEHGLRITAFDGARPVIVSAQGAAVEGADEWYLGFRLAAEEARGLDSQDDNLCVGTLKAVLRPGTALTVVLSAEAAPSRDGEAAWQRRQSHDAEALRRWQCGPSAGAATPGWIQHLVLAADQFVVKRALKDEPDGLSVIAGYHWFGDWGRDTMIALPGLTLATGRAEAACRILITFARFVDRGMVPNVFPDAGEEPEYNTADAALWYIEAVRAYHAASSDDATLARLLPVLEEIIRYYQDGTRYGIRGDAADGLITAGEPGMQLTWMDAKVGDWVVTPRIGKPVEINALWYNALVAMAGFSRRLERPAAGWEAMAAKVQASFARFWNEGAGYCYDVIDGPTGHDAALRPNQIFAVSLPASPLSPERRRQVVDVCARQLLTSFGLRSLAPGDPHYQPRYRGGPRERDGAYHQGTAWGWLLGPFALAHFRVYGDREAARGFLAPMEHHLADYGVGSVAEVFDAEPPFSPGGCIAQAWSVAETLRAWCALTAAR